ncbi:MAG: 5'-nucleotidase, partial [Pyramidobacter sp.]|nr:5'-nucleotidase [Pyramidobacter sp.]
MDVPVVQTGSYGRYLGRLVLTVEGGVTRKDGTKWSLIDLNADVPEEPNLASLLARYAEQFEKELGKSIAVSLDPWDVGKEYVRRNESRVGSFFADALRWKTGTDLAFVNSGSIRGAEVYPAGNISYKTLYTIMPFVNFLTRTEMTGAQLKEFLENSASCLHVDGDGYDGSMRASTGGFLQVSGVRVTFDRSAQPALIDNSGVLRTPGERVKKVEIDRGGVYEPLDPAAVYSVTLYQWTADGGDKFYTTANLPKIDTYVTNTDVIAEYMRHFDGPFRLPPLGRMIFKN